MGGKAAGSGPEPATGCLSGGAAAARQRFSAFFFWRSRKRGAT